ncbi:signal recognition particle-docking protein FtsY [Chlamydiales bacterium]|nr:signal recognition particle-docking protein FtsY [Chlamydiales bacterium]
MIFSRLKQGFQKLKKTFKSTRSLFGDQLRGLFGKSIDETTLSDLEKLFYEADLGPDTAKALTLKVKERASKNSTPEELLAGTKEDLLELLSLPNPEKQTTTPHVILIVGVNGSGKTTSIAKLANLLKKEGQKVLVAACDTFRAAAVDQLERWAKDIDIEIIKGFPNGDPAAVAYDALKAAIARNVDTLIIDTAGRLQNKDHLMKELEKIERICNKLLPGSPHDTFLTIDATTGQNGIDQAKTFNETTPLTGLILTKLDGSAKGGVIVPIQKQLNLSVRYIGLGETINDLEPFDSKNFVDALFS